MSCCALNSKWPKSKESQHNLPVELGLYKTLGNSQLWTEPSAVVVPRLHADDYTPVTQTIRTHQQSTTYKSELISNKQTIIENLSAINKL